MQFNTVRVLFCDNGHIKEISWFSWGDKCFAQSKFSVHVLLRPLQRKFLPHAFQYFNTALKCSVLHNQTFLLPWCKNVKVSHLFALCLFLSNECVILLYKVMVHLNTALPKQGFVVLQLVKWQFNEVVACFLFLLLLLKKSIFTVHCIHVYRVTFITLNQ